MNHTQTAQAAMAQHAQGNAVEAQTEQVVQIGFERALIMMNPEWRTQLAPEVVNQFRHFYHRGVQDLNFLIQMSNQNMAQNVDAVMNTVIVTGNEEQIAKAQREALEAQQAALSTSQIQALAPEQAKPLTKASKQSKPKAAKSEAKKPAKGKAASASKSTTKRVKK